MLVEIVVFCLVLLPAAVLWAIPSGNKTTYQNASGRLLGTVSCGENNDFTRDAFIHIVTSSISNFRISFFE